MYKLWKRVFLAGFLVALALCNANAQKPGANPFAQMMEKSKFTFQLIRTVHQVEEINKNPKYTLSTDQAKRMLAVLGPLRTQPKLTQAKAKASIKGVKSILTIAQLNAMSKVQNRRGFGRRPGGQGRSGRPGMGFPGGMRPGAPPPGMRPGGAPPAGTPHGKGRPGGPGFNPNAMKDFNPFYIKAQGPGGDRWAPFFKSLKAKAAKAGKAPKKR